MFERVRKVVASVQRGIEKCRAWEVEEVEYDYKRVVSQSSGYVVHIRACKQLVNSVDGSKKTSTEQVDTVWMDTQWSIGGPVKWEGNYVYPSKDAVMFGDVARGYQR